MDPVRNPFAPGAGTPPPELAGRSGLLNDIKIALMRMEARRSGKSSILIGLRGVGKTVLLVKTSEMAVSLKYKTINMEAREGTRMVEFFCAQLEKRIIFFESGRDSESRS